MPALTRPSVLVVDDDPSFLASFKPWLHSAGFDACCCTTVPAAVSAARSQPFVAAVVDIVFPAGNGIDLLSELRAIDSNLGVVILTGQGDIPTAVEATRRGAYDYLTKPVEPERLRKALENIIAVRVLAGRNHDLETRVEQLSRELHHRSAMGCLIGGGQPMQQVFDRIEAASRVRSTVLIVGESGTGKELVARAIHERSGLGGGFLPVNCAALPHDLVESELFGHRRGAFSGAVGESRGMFRAADGGTLFLDEVTELPVAVQAKLLRALQERAIRPVGEVCEIPVNCRVIAATNRVPATAVKDGHLRLDLFYRLSVITIEVPSLRERRQDIPTLVNQLVARIAPAVSREVPTIPAEVMRVLSRHDWPGNVRELENALEQALVFSRGTSLTVPDLPESVSARSNPHAFDLIGLVSLKEAEQRAIRNALQITQGNKALAAKALGISRKQLYVKLAQMGDPTSLPAPGEPE